MTLEHTSRPPFRRSALFEPVRPSARYRVLSCPEGAYRQRGQTEEREFEHSSFSICRLSRPLRSRRLQQPRRGRKRPKLLMGAGRWSPAAASPPRVAVPCPMPTEAALRLCQDVVPNARGGGPPYEAPAPAYLRSRSAAEASAPASAVCFQCLFEPAGTAQAVARLTVRRWSAPVNKPGGARPVVQRQPPIVQSWAPSAGESLRCRPAATTPAEEFFAPKPPAARGVAQAKFVSTIFQRMKALVIVRPGAFEAGSRWRRVLQALSPSVSWCRPARQPSDTGYIRPPG